MTHFPFCINLVIFIFVYPVESYGYFLGIYRRLGHSIDFVNMKFVVEVIFFLINSTGKLIFVESSLQNFAIFVDVWKNAPKKKAPGTLPPQHL